ncbi:hypothetical protein BFP70_00160 [Thioclava sp. SK-1]|uniref:hypothetical protein n=1 Tax=Thioclava sp. SK-1 TaxID=1889770 RepID=UPI0008259BF4|nr:hypothetical protein [Thioclava sp. SK-1]OCX66621.1 hypothetical protein BFP70_00160 [Thioclava sp. SK-1]
MTRISVILAAVALTACTVDENGNIIMPPPQGQAAAPRMDQEGTCFMYVEDQGEGRYRLVNGVGDGTRTPLAMVKSDLTSAQLDARYTKERAIMDINPECLAIVAKDRAQARPVRKPKAPMGG